MDYKTLMQRSAIFMLCAGATLFSEAKPKTPTDVELFGEKVMVFRPTDNMDSINAGSTVSTTRCSASNLAQAAMRFLFMPGDYREAGLLNIPYYVHMAVSAGPPMRYRSAISTPPRRLPTTTAPAPSGAVSKTFRSPAPRARSMTRCFAGQCHRQPRYAAYTATAPCATSGTTAG